MPPKRVIPPVPAEADLEARTAWAFPFSHLHRLSVSRKHAHTRFLRQRPRLP
jgi:hypothetical protein